MYDENRPGSGRDDDRARAPDDNGPGFEGESIGGTNVDGTGSTTEIPVVPEEPDQPAPEPPAMRTGDPPVTAMPAGDPHDVPENELSPEPHFEEGLVDELSHVIEDGINYAKAEAAFQKTRASLAIKSAGMAAGLGVGALVVLNIAVIALSVGLIIALAPLVTIWGAIAIVVGALLVVTAIIALKAKNYATRAANLFSGEEKPL